MRTGALTAATVVGVLLAVPGGWAAGSALAGRGGGSSAAAGTADGAVETPAPLPVASPTPSPTPSVQPTPSPPPTPQDLLERAKRATVRLSLLDGTGRGSGTVVSPDGLLLTNAHVAAPQAPGLAFHYSDPATEPDPGVMLVSVSPPGDGPAVPAYRARVVVADGYLDLAVLQVEALADGSPLPTDLVLDAIPVGDSDALRTGQRLTVLGFPTIAAGGTSQSVTIGEVATFVTDPADRVVDPRWEIDTSARIARGNSGGAAVSERGELVGVPSASSRQGEYTGRIRPVKLAAALLAAAADGTAGSYVSPYDVLGTGLETGRPYGWGTASSDDCSELDADTLPAAAKTVVGAASLSGMTVGEDYLLVLGREGGGTVATPQRGTWRGPAATGCLRPTFTLVTADEPNGLPPGDYELRVHVGPQLREVTRVPLRLE